MDLNYKLYIEKANNELKLAKIILEISTNKQMKTEIFNISNDETFFSAVITHSYYSIFYSAKAYLLKNNIKTKAPEEHKKTYDEFKKLVDMGKIDLELLKYYSELILKAEELLGIFKLEKKKRGEFTYQKLSQANQLPSQNSLNNARIFFKNIYNLLDND